VTVMDSSASIGWAQFWIGVGLQRALFPDYVARAMAADSEKTLRTANIILLIMPFFIQAPLCLFGLCGRVAHPETENPKAIFSLVVMDIINSGFIGRIFGSISLAASLAAIMSTADSCLISVSHMVTLDVLKPLVGDENASEEEDKKLLMFGRGVTLALAVVCAGLAAAVDVNLSFMIQFQSAFLSQCFPAMVLGLYFPQLSEKSVLAGLLVGEVVGVSLVGTKFPGGVIIAIVLNIAVTFGVAAAMPNDKPLPSGFGFEDKAKEIASALSTTGELRKEPVSSLKPALIAACLVPWLAIPFYRESGATDSLIMGVPVWAACSLLVLALSHILIGGILYKGWDVEEPTVATHEAKPAAETVGAETTDPTTA